MNNEYPMGTIYKEACLCCLQLSLIHCFHKTKSWVMGKDKEWIEIIEPKKDNIAVILGTDI